MKKSQLFTLKFIINLLLALLVFIPAIMFAGKLFRLSSDAVDSFNVLVDLMQKASVSEDKVFNEKTVLNMDKDTGIAFFERGNKYLSFMRATDGGVWVGGDHICIPKPESCGEEACVCLFRRPESTEFDPSPDQGACNSNMDMDSLLGKCCDSYGESSCDTSYIELFESCNLKWESGGFEYYSGESICSNFPDVNFDVEKGFPFLYPTLAEMSQAENDQVLTNQELFFGGWEISRFANKPRTKVVTVERYGSTLSVCTRDDCIPENKKIMEDALYKLKEAYASEEFGEDCVSAEFISSNILIDDELYLTQEGTNIRAEYFVEPWSITTRYLEKTSIKFEGNLCEYDFETGEVSDVNQITLKRGDFESKYAFSDKVYDYNYWYLLVNKDDKKCFAVHELDSQPAHIILEEEHHPYEGFVWKEPWPFQGFYPAFNQSNSFGLCNKDYKPLHFVVLPINYVGEQEVYESQATQLLYNLFTNTGTFSLPCSHPYNIDITILPLSSNCELNFENFGPNNRCYVDGEETYGYFKTCISDYNPELLGSNNDFTIWGLENHDFSLTPDLSQEQKNSYCTDFEVEEQSPYGSQVFELGPINSNVWLLNVLHPGILMTDWTAYNSFYGHSCMYPVSEQQLETEFTIIIGD